MANDRAELPNEEGGSTSGAGAAPRSRPLPRGDIPPYEKPEEMGVWWWWNCGAGQYQRYHTSWGGERRTGRGGRRREHRTAWGIRQQSSRRRSINCSSCVFLARGRPQHLHLAVALDHGPLLCTISCRRHALQPHAP